MGWSLKVFTDLGIDHEVVQDEVDCIKVYYKKVHMLVRLSSCRISPIGIDMIQKRKLPLVDRDCLPTYDKRELQACRELASLVMRGSTKHEKVIWIRNANGVVIGLK
jgi:hypothetical protein